MRSRTTKLKHHFKQCTAWPPCQHSNRSNETFSIRCLVAKWRLATHCLCWAMCGTWGSSKFAVYVTCCTSSLACPQRGTLKTNAKVLNVCQIVYNLCAVLCFPFLFSLCFCFFPLLLCIVVRFTAWFSINALLLLLFAASVAGFDTNFELCGAPQNIAQSVNMVEDF